MLHDIPYFNSLSNFSLSRASPDSTENAQRSAKISANNKICTLNK